MSDNERDERRQEGISFHTGQLIEEVQRLNAWREDMDRRLAALEDHYSREDGMFESIAHRLGALEQRIQTLNFVWGQEAELFDERLKALEQQRQPCENKMQEIAFLLQALDKPIREGKVKVSEEDVLRWMQVNVETTPSGTLRMGKQPLDAADLAQMEAVFRKQHPDLAASYCCTICGSAQKCDCRQPLPDACPRCLGTTYCSCNLDEGKKPWLPPAMGHAPPPPPSRNDRNLPVCSCFYCELADRVLHAETKDEAARLLREGFNEAGDNLMAAWKERHGGE